MRTFAFKSSISIFLLSIILCGCRSWTALMKVQLSDVIANGDYVSKNIKDCKEMEIDYKQSVLCGTYDADDFKFIFEGSSKNFSVTIQNKTNKKVYVFWNEALILYPDNTSDFVVNSSTPNFTKVTTSTSKGKANAFDLNGNMAFGSSTQRTTTSETKESQGMVIPVFSTIKQFITRNDMVGKTILPLHSKSKSKMFNVYNSFVNEKVKIFIPIQIDGTTYDFLFEFTIKSVEMV